MSEHGHTLIAEAQPSPIEGVTQWQLGCHVCGPQWVMTVDWRFETIRVAWLHEPMSVSLSSWREPRIEGGRNIG